MTPGLRVRQKLRPQGQLDQVCFQFPFPSEVSTWGQLVALHRPSLLRVLSSFSNRKRKKKWKKQISVSNQTRKPTTPRAAAGRGRGAAGSAEKAEAAGAATAEAQRPEAQARPGRRLLAAPGPARRRARRGAHGPAGPGRKSAAAAAGGLLSDGGGGRARAGRRAAGRGSERAGRSPRRSVAGRARPGPRGGGGGGGGRGAGSAAGGRPGAGLRLAAWPQRPHSWPGWGTRGLCQSRRVGIARGLVLPPRPPAIRALLPCSDPASPLAALAGGGAGGLRAETARGPLRAAWSLQESRGPALVAPPCLSFPGGQSTRCAARGRLRPGRASLPACPRCAMGGPGYHPRLARSSL